MAVNGAIFEFMASMEARIVILFSVMAALIAVGVYAILKFRPVRDDDSPTSELISEFSKLHLRGALSDEEFRTVKTILNEKLQQEIMGGAAVVEPQAKPPQEQAD